MPLRFVASALYRKVHELGDEDFVLRDPTARYSELSSPEIEALSLECP